MVHTDKLVRVSSSIAYVISHDDGCGNPRNEFSNLGHVAIYPKVHSKYRIADKPIEFEKASSIEASSNYVSLPIYMYAHSGITIRTTPYSCPWDSGKVGIIYLSKKEIRDQYGWKSVTAKRVKTIQQVFVNEIQVLDHYITGETYMFRIYNDSRIGSMTDLEVMNEIEVDPDNESYGYYGEEHVLSEVNDRVGFMLYSESNALATV